MCRATQYSTKQIESERMCYLCQSFNDATLRAYMEQSMKIGLHSPC
jgi:hypothetical protein